MNCPKCKCEIPTETIAAEFAAMGGRAGKGAAKARDSKAMSAAAQRRWINAERQLYILKCSDGVVRRTYAVSPRAARSVKPERGFKVLAVRLGTEADGLPGWRRKF